MEPNEIYKHQKANAEPSRHHTVSGNFGMAASAVKEATEAGAKVLRDGGNAADAIIAIQFALAVVEGMDTGIGGSGFLNYHDAAKNETKVINGHTQAPAAVKPDLFLDENGEAIPFTERTTSAKAVGVPGIMKAMQTAHERFGSLPLERLIDPAIRLAEEEYRVDFLWERGIKLFDYRMGEEAKKFFIPDGVPLVEGDSVVQPDLAKTLRLIRDQGIDAVYEGEIADAIVQTVQDKGGLLTKLDMQNYRVSIDEPLWSNYRDVEVALPAPPDGGGFAVAQLLKLLEPFNISQYDRDSWEKYYLIAEALEVTLADKHAYMADPAFIDIPLNGLLHSDYIDERRKLFSFDAHNEDINPGNPWKYQQGEPNHRIHQEPVTEGAETTHFTVVDQWGNVAACTSSIERMFGSGIMVPGYGFLLNNDLTDFNPTPGTVNEARGGKRAVSAKSPTIIFRNGEPVLTLGSPGGSTIVASVAQVLLHVLDYKMDLDEAIAEPRLFNSQRMSVQLEEDIPASIESKLKEKGFKVETGKMPDLRIGDVQAILRNPMAGKLYGAADTARPGAAIGVQEQPCNQDEE